MTEKGPEFRERFRREARRMARLLHPSIVAVHEFDVHAGRAYLSMDYVDGGSLARASLEPRALVRALRPVVDALEHAHARGIVHRDLKPENVLLDRRGRAFLCDFGLALDAAEDAAHPDACAVAGTPLSMSPEQARGEEAGPSSDVFSLGVTLYRQLAHQWPFRGRTVADVLHAIQHEPPRPLRELAPAVPRPLEAIVLRCLAKDPARRYGSMQELGLALDRFLERRSLIAQFWDAIASRRSSDRGRTHSRPASPTHLARRIHPEDFS
jgi:serine/threonine-protein kinase